MRLLVVEDEPDLARVIVRRLKEEGYGVDLAGDGEQALGFVNVVKYDGIILDQLLPVRDGLSFLKEIRNRGDSTPVLILTALDALEAKVKGLDAGADGYLTKPFAFEELFARVRALLRREGERCQGTRLAVADLTLDTVTHRVTRSGQEIQLTAKEYALLEYLLRHPDRVLSRSQIAEHVWDYDFTGLSNVVDVYIRYLRRKIDDLFAPKLIQTVRGIGYRLRVPE